MQHDVSIQSSPVTITGPSAFCNDGQIHYYDVPVIPGFTCTWTITGGTFSNGQTTAAGAAQEVSWGTSGGSISVTCSDASQICSQTATLAVSVFLPPLLSTSFYGEGCAGNCNYDVSVLVDGGLGPFNFTWTDAAGTEVGTTMEVTGLCTGTYNVVVVDENDCAANAQVVLPADGSPAPPTVPAAFYACGDGDATYTLEATDVVAGATVEWFAPGTSTPFGFDIITFSNGNFQIGTFSDFMVRQCIGTCCSDFVNFDIIVEVPQAPVVPVVYACAKDLFSPVVVVTDPTSISGQYELFSDAGLTNLVMSSNTNELIIPTSSIPVPLVEATHIFWMVYTDDDCTSPATQVKVVIEKSPNPYPKHIYHPTGTRFQTSAITTDDQGSTYVTGYFLNQLTFAGPDNVISGNNRPSIFVVKYDNCGKLIWVNAYGQVSSGNGSRSTDITTNANGGVFVTGLFNGIGADFGNTTLNGKGTFVLRIKSSDGSTEWVKSGVGGINGGTGIAVNQNNEIFISGRYTQQGNSNSISFDITTQNFNNTEDYFVASFKAVDGSCQWISPVGLSGGSSISTGLPTESIDIDGNGQVYISGSYQGAIGFSSTPPVSISSSGFKDIFLASFETASGNATQISNFGGADSDDVHHDLAIDQNGQAYITGSFNGTISYQNAGINLTSNALRDGLVFMMDATGQPVWAKQFNGPGSHDNGVAIELDESGNILLAGNFKGNTLTFDGSSYGTGGTVNSNYSFVSSMSPSNGMVDWVAMPNPLSPKYSLLSADLSVGPNNTAYFTGQFRGKFDFSNNASPALSSFSYDGFVARVHPQGSLFKTPGEQVADPEDWQIQYGRVPEVELYPNPNRGQFNLAIKSDGMSATVSVRIYNAIGDEVYAIDELQTPVQQVLNLQHIAPGLHVVQVSFGGQSVYKKMVVTNTGM